MCELITGVGLTELAIDLIEGRDFGHLATLMSDGSPHVTPVRVDREGDLILINTSLGRVKQRNLARDPRVTIDIADQEYPYRMVSIRGRVVDQPQDGADEHIDRLAKKYFGKDKVAIQTTR